jgi:hypothetical protein
MPLIARKITVENENTTFSKDTVEHVHYVPKSKMKPGDRIVDPVSHAQLAELAALYPDEYADKAKAAGVEPALGDGRLAQLLLLPAKELVKKISEMTPDVDLEILWALYEAEVADDGEEGDGTGKNRTTVLEALAEKGIEEGEES